MPLQICTWSCSGLDNAGLFSGHLEYLGLTPSEIASAGEPLEDGLTETPGCLARRMQQEQRERDSSVEGMAGTIACQGYTAAEFAVRGLTKSTAKFVIDGGCTAGLAHKSSPRSKSRSSPSGSLRPRLPNERGDTQR